MENTSKKKRKPLSAQVSLFGGLAATISAVALFLSFLGLENVFRIEGTDRYFAYFTGAAMVAIGLVQLPLIPITKSKFVKIKYLCLMGSYVTLGIVTCFVPFTGLAFSIIAGLFGCTIAANRICIAIETRTKRSIIGNALLALIALFLSVSGFMDATTLNASDAKIVLLLLLFLMFTVSLSHILYFAFSKIRFTLLLKIMRKTYAFEILYGLLLMIVCFSLVFTLTEPNFKNYWDGVWYCFAVVTTIGFGDFYTVNILGRVLTVILGIYGVIVVALLTSIIVNFYTEITNKEKKAEEEALAEIAAEKAEEKVEEIMDRLIQEEKEKEEAESAEEAEKTEEAKPKENDPTASDED